MSKANTIRKIEAAHSPLDISHGLQDLGLRGALSRLSEGKVGMLKLLLDNQKRMSFRPGERGC